MRYLIYCLSILSFLTISFANTDVHASYSCTPGLSTIIGTEYVADKCSYLGPPFNYMATDLVCENGVVKQYPGGTYNYYNQSPESFQAAILSSASYLGMTVFRNTEGSQFLTVTKYFSWGGGSIGGVRLDNFSPAPSVHYDIFNTYFFPPLSLPDEDGDGYLVCDDCNDTDPSINPGASEICNDGIDNDCNGYADCHDSACPAEDCCTDEDGDGFFVNGGDCGPKDCNDNDPQIHPEAEEVCDGIDNDCDALVDESTLQILSFSSDTTVINPESGGQVSFDFSVDPSYDTATITIGGEDIGGQTWNGTLGGKLVEPGSYSAELTVTKGDCKDTESTLVRVEPYEGCALKVTVGSSANLASGELSDRLDLFSFSGPGPFFGIDLYYHSLDGRMGPLGRGWTHNYDIFITETEFGEAVLHEGNGTRLLYTPEEWEYSSQPGDFSQLSLDENGLFVLTRKNGTRYHFNSEGRISRIIDRNGNALTFFYAGELLSEVTDPAGRSIIFSYGAAGDLASLTDPAGRVTTLSVGDSLNSVTFPDGATWGYRYEGEAFLAEKTDPLGNVTSYAYDSQHRVISSIDPQGLERTIFYPVSNETVKTTSIIEKDGGEWTYTYDSQAGDLRSKGDPDGNVTTYAYDANHNRTEKTDASGTTSNTYDAEGNLTSVTDPMGQTTAYTYNEYGQITSAITPQGATTSYVYDNRGNLVETRDPSGSSTKYSYDERGNLLSITDTAGNTTSMEHDDFGNLIATTDATGATTRLEYDAAGRMIRQVDPDGGVTSMDYDDRGNLIQIVDPLGHRTSYTYDYAGNKISETDANGLSTEYAYNARGQMIRAIDALGQITEFTYEATGCADCTSSGEKLTSLIDAKGQSTIFEYDQIGRLIRETDPLGNPTVYRYDASGNLESRTDAKGQTTAFTHDALGRLLEKTYPDGSMVSFTYNADGKILTASNENISYSYSYDPSGRVTSVHDSFGRTIEYEYDALGRRIKMIAPDGRQTSYDYDEAGRLQSLASEGTTSFTYDALGRRSSMRQPNGVRTTYTYDAAGRLTSILAKNAIGWVVSESAYTHDPTGNRLSKKSDNRTINYVYDKIYQLTEANPQFSLSLNPAPKEFYLYDPVGNREKTHRADNYAHNAGNQLLGAASTSYSYDPNGNLIAKTEEDEALCDINFLDPLNLLGEDGTSTTHYSWDFENRLTRVDHLDGTVVEFKYDPFGRRIEKKVHNTQEEKIIRYLYDNEDILYTYDAAGDVIIRFTHGPGIDEPLAVIQDGKTYYYHADGLGSVTALTGKLGSVVQKYRYDSFGNIYDTEGYIKQPYTYTGREWDRETGLYYYRARYYDPMEGRFISKDPIGFKGGINQFAYTLNNPVRFIDPMGLKVSLCGATADIPFNIFQLKHFWLKTDTYEVGLGPANGGVPGENGQVDSPYISDTTLTNHAGRSGKPGASCVELTNVDESCVDCELSKMGIPKGKWTSMNNCVTAVLQIISKCQK